MRPRPAWIAGGEPGPGSSAGQPGRSTADTASRVSRRTFTGSVIAVALARPGRARAQAPRRPVQIGLLGILPTADITGPQPRSPTTAAFLRALIELGYEYGSDFVTVPKGAGGRPDRYPRLAAELLRAQVDVIVAAGPALRALKEAAVTIPVVMAASPDPLDEGLVRSLARPGGTFTGLSLQSTETIGKRLELLKELVPGPAPVAVLWNGRSSHWQVAEAAARARGWKLLSVVLRDTAGLEAAFNAATSAGAGTILVLAAALIFQQAGRVAELAARARLPAMYELRAYVEAGGLVSYGPDIVDVWRRAAVFVDKILKGARPADLPIEQPSVFELIVNLGTARALGLTVPPALLLRADEVIS